MPRDDADLVWSSDGGDRRTRSGSGRAPGRRGRGPATPARPAAAGGRVKVRRETAGRRGKTVTTVSDVPVDGDALRALAGRLKKRCGVGGSAKDGVIEIQGDHRDVVLEILLAEGFDAVLAGG
ncbi:MAG: stress response translation initiation inhibitor YciH [Solirubrobacteraceae bacterium]|nr:stress response translation initiation inhibitor YciH [Solirubrobacteraceae bacterium]